MKRERRRHAGRVLAAAIAVAIAGGPWAMALAAAENGRKDVKDLLTEWAPRGIPYAEARAYGPRAVPELVAMLNDPALEAHWTKVIWVMGCIGDASATTPLLDFLERQRGEVSVDAFRAALAIGPALGHLAREGDARALESLKALVRSDRVRKGAPDFSYRRYRGEALDEVLARTAIQGLGIAGTPEALAVLQAMGPNLRADWTDNVSEAIELNLRVSQIGPDRAFAPRSHH
jgi:HEAT repeat protein